MPRRSTLSTFRAFSIDTASAEPLHRQLYSEIRVAILKGRLVSGARLPASRELALVTHVSRNTVLSAYEQLLAEGYIESRPGSGTFVAHTLPESMLPEAAPTLPAAGTHSPRPIAKRGRRLLEAPLLQHRHKGVTHIFRPGLPALDHFPMAIWRRLSDRRFARASMRMLSYDDPQGYLPLREAICRHLAEARGARCVPENIIIVSGSQQAIDLASRLLLDPDDTVLMEDPGYFGARAAFVASGARVEPVAVDHEGFDIAKARPEAESIARLAYVTPSHQNPQCVTMSLPQ